MGSFGHLAPTVPTLCNRAYIFAHAPLPLWRARGAHLTAVHSHPQRHNCGAHLSVGRGRPQRHNRGLWQQQRFPTPRMADSPSPSSAAEPLNDYKLSLWSRLPHLDLLGQHLVRQVLSVA